jgi:hypothetical protein
MERRCINMSAKNNRQNKNLSSSVLDAINKNNIKPDSKNKIFYRSISLYTLIAIGLFLLSLIMLITVNTFNRSLFLEASLRDQKLIAIFVAVPWPLVLVSLVGITFSAFLITKTDYGYKYRKVVILPVIVMAVAIFAGMVYAVGVRHAVGNDYRIENQNQEGMVKFNGRLMSVEASGISDQQKLKIKSKSGKEQMLIINSKTKCHPRDCDKLDFEEGLPVAGWGRESEDGEIIVSDIFIKPLGPGMNKPRARGMNIK